MNETPEIKAYTKLQLRYLLKNPHCNLLSKRDKRTGILEIPHSSAWLKRHLQPFFRELNIKSELHYNSLRELTEKQVKIIFDVLL